MYPICMVGFLLDDDDYGETCKPSYKKWWQNCGPSEIIITKTKLIFSDSMRKEQSDPKIFYPLNGGGFHGDDLPW